MGHIFYRKDCLTCVQGSGLGLQHRKIKFKGSFALAYDLAGPEIGKTPDGTGFKYLLVAGFCVPMCLFLRARRRRILRSQKRLVRRRFVQPAVPGA